MKNKIFSIVVAFMLLAFAVIPVSANYGHGGQDIDYYYKWYHDVEGDEWYAESVAEASRRGLFSGMNYSRTFVPGAELTREMAVAVLYRMEFGIDSYIDETNTQYKETETPFDDVSPKAWFAPFVGWASQNGIVEGVGVGKFGTGCAITREELATILARYLSYKGLSLVESDGGKTEFEDAADVSEWAADAVAVLSDGGVVKGDENGNFNPKASITRAEAATVFVRFDESLAFDMAYFFDFEEVAEVEFSYWRGGEYKRIITVSEETELEALLETFANMKFSGTESRIYAVTGGAAISFKMKNSDGVVIYSNTFGPGRMGSAGSRVYFFEEEYFREYYDVLLSE